MGQAAEGSLSSPVASRIARPLDTARSSILHGAIAMIDVNGAQNTPEVVITHESHVARKVRTSAAMLTVRSCVAVKM
jgi:hypothetical protein